VTLTYEERAWILNMMHRLIMMDS